jgi:hypothetical protein
MRLANQILKSSAWKGSSRDFGMTGHLCIPQSCRRAAECGFGCRESHLLRSELRAWPR